MLRTVRSLPLTGLSTLGFDTRRFPLMPPACYRASWQLPGPDFHRQATASLRPAINHLTRSTSSLLDAQWNKVEHRLFSHITMNWRGRPLASHEVIVNTIGATTTTTGLRVRAELDTGTCDTGTKISDRQMDALPLSRHDWHGDWNYTLRPEDYDRAAGVPDPFDQPSPDLAWLCHPALTGLPGQQWDALIAALMTLHDQQRETSLERRRGHRPRLTAPGTGRRPVLTLADRLLATVLHQRLVLPQVAIATLFSVRPETINKRIRDIRQLLEQAGHAIEPGPHQLASLDDLSNLAAAEGILAPAEIKTAC